MTSWLGSSVLALITIASAAFVVGCDPPTDPADSASESAAQEPGTTRGAAAPVLGPKVFPLEAAHTLDGRGRDDWQLPDDVVAAGLRHERDIELLRFHSLQVFRKPVAGRR